MLSLSRVVPLVILALAACGDDDPGTTDTTTTSDTSPADVEDHDQLPPVDEHTSGDGDADGDGEVVAPVDQDGDGLSDAEEATLGTDPAAPDSDEDGYWDGWEQAAGSDPKDKGSTPTLPEPEGAPYILDLVDIIEPVLLRSFLSNILDRWPPILVFVDGQGDGPVTITGGIAARTSLGADDAAGTADDVYSLELGSLDPATGAFQVRLAGTRTGDAITATADEVVIDLSNVSEVVRGVRLRVEDVTFEAMFVDGGQRLEPTRLAGVLSRAGVEEILDNADLPLPIDTETAMEILDPDGDGIIAVDIALKGRTALAGGWVLEADAEPVVRDPGACCPEGLEVGDAIDPALTIVDQGAQPEEEPFVAAIVERALAHPTLLDFVATQRVVGGERRTYLYSPRGHVYFVRQRVTVEGQPATIYKTWLLASADALEGEPIANDDPRSPLADQSATTLSAYADFLAAGAPFLPNDDYEALGYTASDERLRHVPVGDNPYPFGYERLAAIFDDPRTGDVILQPVSYAGSRGDHGHLSALQSRSPLILSGKGVKRAGDASGAGWSTVCVGGCGEASVQMLMRDDAARIVDVAPTIAKALGVTTRTGVGPHGHLADDVYLAWQDGRPLVDVLDGETPAHALIIINDGLTSMELLYQALAEDRDVGAYRELMARGVTLRHGAITNFPSNTYPSHNVVGAGAYSGHHGIVDNGFYEREVAHLFEPIVDLFGTERFIGGAHPGLPIETLHEAVTRSFGGAWDKSDNAEGAFTASLNDPSTRGAVLATLERRVPDGYDVPDAASSLELGGVTYEYPVAALTDAAGLLDNSTLTAAYGLFIANPAQGVPIPRYAIINLASTDGAGHKSGPHGPDERDRVVKATNDRLAILIAILKQAGIYDDTLIVLTADHGMELKDPNVQGDVLGGLSADIAIVRDHFFVYIKQLDVAHGALPAGTGDVTFTVTDHDGGGAIEGATLTVKDGASELGTATTGADGTATLTLALGGATAPTVTITKTGFTTQAHALER